MVALLRGRRARLPVAGRARGGVGPARAESVSPRTDVGGGEPRGGRRRPREHEQSLQHRPRRPLCGRPGSPSHKCLPRAFRARPGCEPTHDHPAPVGCSKEGGGTATARWGRRRLAWAYTSIASMLGGRPRVSVSAIREVITLSSSFRTSAACSGGPATCEGESLALQPPRRAADAARVGRVAGAPALSSAAGMQSAQKRTARSALATGCGGGFPSSESARLSVSRHHVRRIAASFGSFAASIAWGRARAGACRWDGEPGSALPRLRAAAC